MSVAFPSVAAMSESLPSGETEILDGGVTETVRLPIVMYHHLSPKAKLWNDYVLPVEQFGNDLKYLKERGYESVTLTQLLAWYDGEASLPEKPFMITFDDGFESTDIYARPILEKYEFTAIVAVIGSAADLFSENDDHTPDYSHLNWETVRSLAQTGVFEFQCHSFNMHKFDVFAGSERLCMTLSAQLWRTFRIFSFSL